MVDNKSRKPNPNDWCEAPLQVWVKSDDGTIHYDSLFEKRWPGSFELLMACVEDNIYDDGFIDWAKVQDEYLAQTTAKNNDN